MLLADAKRGTPLSLGIRTALFVLWCAAALYLCWNHHFWRDEVRALSLALSGHNFIDMAGAVHGEGHPLLWYVLLRLVHTVINAPVALPITAFLVGAAAAALLAFRSPFGFLPLALLLFGHMMLFEYTVMARNYGISMLLLFATAIAYPHWRRHGYWLGVLLFLLVNTNVHSVVLAAAFLLFWLLDLVLEEGLRWTPALTNLAKNAAIAAVGVAICAATVYPPFNDAAGFHHPPMSAQVLIEDVKKFFSLDHTLDGPWKLMPFMLLGTVAGMVFRPQAAAALLAAWFGMAVFFVAIYSGTYRHGALWLAFAVAIYWIIIARGEPDAAGREDQPIRTWIARLGTIAFLGLLAFQTLSGVSTLATARGAPPASRAAEFGAFMRARPDLANATIIADPDYLLETLPYYIDNPTYLTRENRADSIVKFTRHARLTLSLADLLSTAHQLAAQRSTPIIILLTARLDQTGETSLLHEGYDWTFTMDPAQIATFRQQTQLLANFRGAEGDENFDAYLLKTDAPL